jgi:hypothetical protein
MCLFDPSACSVVVLDVVHLSPLLLVRRCRGKGFKQRHPQIIKTNVQVQIKERQLAANPTAIADFINNWANLVDDYCQKGQPIRGCDIGMAMRWEMAVATMTLSIVCSIQVRVLLRPVNPTTETPPKPTALANRRIFPCLLWCAKTADLLRRVAQVLKDNEGAVWQHAIRSNEAVGEAFPDDPNHNSRSDEQQDDEDAQIAMQLVMMERDDESEMECDEDELEAQDE